MAEKKSSTAGVAAAAAAATAIEATTRANNEKQRQTNDWKEVHTINSRCAFSHTNNWTWKLYREIVVHAAPLPGTPADARKAFLLAACTHTLAFVSQHSSNFSWTAAATAATAAAATVAVLHPSGDALLSVIELNDSPNRNGEGNFLFCGTHTRTHWRGDATTVCWSDRWTEELRDCRMEATNRVAWSSG